MKRLLLGGFLGAGLMWLLLRTDIHVLVQVGAVGAGVLLAVGFVVGIVALWEMG